jgi:aspartate aminotransferase
MTVIPAAPGRPFAPSSNVAFLKESATIAVSNRAKALRTQGRDIIDLGVGEPDFPTPAPIIAAAKQALDDGATRYTATEGILPLRQAIARDATALSADNFTIDPSEIVVSNGTKQTLFNACFVLFGEGDDVLVPAPAWTSYYELVALSKANVVPVEGDPALGLKVTAELLAKAATPATKGLILNSPCNPTGSVHTRQELTDILQLADERGWWVISDEIYRRISYVGEVTSALAVAPSRDRLVVVDGVAKSYAMTGWRIGWSVAPKAVTQAMIALQSHATSNAGTPSQHAALAALTIGPLIEASIHAMVGEFRERRDACLAVLADEPRIECVRPDGAFYLFLKIGGDTTAFATRLLEDHGVAVVPGAAFMAPDWIRMSYATRQALAVEVVRRIVALWRSMHHG